MENTANKTDYNKKIIVKISAKDFLISLLCFIMSKIQFMLYMNPFGMAFYGATFTPTGWYWSLVALIIGTAFSKGDFTAFRYILSAGLATPVIAFSKSSKPVFRALTISLCYLIVSTALMFTGKFLTYDYIVVTFESFICFIFCYLLNGTADVLINYSKKEEFTQNETVSVVVTVFLLLLWIASFPDIAGFRLCALVSVFVLMYIANSHGIYMVAAGGIITGFAICIAQQQSVSVVGSYAFCSLASVLFKKYGRLGVFFGFTFANTIITAFFNDDLYLLINPMEIFIAGMVFVSFPKKAIYKVNKFFDKLFNKDKANNQKIYNRDTIKEISKNLSQLSQLYLKDLKPRVLGKQYVNNLFNMCVERVCSNCGLKMSCWQSSTYRNYEYMSKMFEYAHKKGHLDSGGLPSEFLKRCVKKDEFIRGFNFCYDLYNTDRIWLNKIFRIKTLMSHQLSAIANSLETCFEKDMYVDYKLISDFCQQNKTGESVCGDCVCELDLPDGNYVAVLADGMGSGNEAHSYSNDIAVMFSLFASIGVDIEKAVELVNLSMCVKSERECFSTLDIIYVDFENSRLSVIKAGTSPTYVVSEQGVKKYECNTLPVGILKDIQIQKYTIPISDNMLILMTSDGISNSVLKEDSEFDWIGQMLEKEKTNNPKKISEIAVKEAISKNEGIISDDMTAYALRILKQ